MFIFSGEVLVGHAPNTQLILYDISTPVDIPDTITGTLFITNYQLCFRPIPFLVEKVYSIIVSTQNTCFIHYIKINLVLLI